MGMLLDKRDRFRARRHEGPPRPCALGKALPPDPIDLDKDGSLVLKEATRLHRLSESLLRDAEGTLERMKRLEEAEGERPARKLII